VQPTIKNRIRTDPIHTNIRKMSYHKPEAKTVQDLKDLAQKLRIHSINATQASKSG